MGNTQSQMLCVSCWRWGTKYPDAYVDKLRASVARNLSLPYEFRVFTPEPEDQGLTQIPGCFARLRAFDPAWQAAQGFGPGDRIVCLDLDLVVTGSLNLLLSRPEPFAILSGVNSANPCRMNGSVWWTAAGYRPDVWSDFSVGAVSRLPCHDFPDDQLWLEHKLPDGAEITTADGVYAFQKRG